MNSIRKIIAQKSLQKSDLIALLSIQKSEDLQILYAAAYKVKSQFVGNIVYLRGIIEFSNICTKNCYYCGIRRDNHRVQRYMMSEEEILATARWAWQARYGSLVLQSGERMDSKFVHCVEQLVLKIREMTNSELGITLSLGEQSEETYRRWFAAGAHRYLLRIETSNRELYHALHPEDHDYDRRLQSLQLLRKVGYQVGTGVMIGLPGQTINDLAEDVLFLKRHDIDMIGMGPFIPHKDTPLADSLGDFNRMKLSQLELGLKMIAVTRLLLKDVNIAATTALQALKQDGRELGIQAGANVIMPNITNTKYRDAYQLYNDKPCPDEDSGICTDRLERRIRALSERIGYNQWGDSPHFKKRFGTTKPKSH
jgi:biotin synthase